MDDALDLSTVEGLCGGPLLGAVDVCRSRLAVASNDGETRGVISPSVSSYLFGQNSPKFIWKDDLIGIVVTAGLY